MRDWKFPQKKNKLKQKFLLIKKEEVRDFLKTWTTVESCFLCLALSLQTIGNLSLVTLEMNEEELHVHVC